MVRRDELRATQAEQDLVLNNEKIEILWNYEVIGLNPPQSPFDKGDGNLYAVSLRNNKTGEEKVMSIDGLFVAIGREPSTGFLKNLIKLKDNNYIITGENNVYKSMTSIKGMFAAGDCMDEVYRQAIVAAGAGAKAAIDCERWMKSTST